MTPELKWLMYTALLAGSLWIPFITGVNIADFPGKEQQFVRPPDHSQIKPGCIAVFVLTKICWCNSFLFAIVVLAGAVSRVSTPTTVVC
jgi:hypothetical protein